MGEILLCERKYKDNLMDGRFPMATYLDTLQSCINASANPTAVGTHPIRTQFCPFGRKNSDR